MRGVGTEKVDAMTRPSTIAPRLGASLDELKAERLTLIALHRQDMAENARKQREWMKEMKR